VAQGHGLNGRDGSGRDVIRIPTDWSVRMARKCESMEETGGACPNYAVPGSRLCRRHLAKKTAVPGVAAFGGAILGHLAVPGGVGAILGAILGAVIGPIIWTRRTNA
jgi:hypothetical protein